MLSVHVSPSGAVYHVCPKQPPDSALIQAPGQESQKATTRYGTLTDNTGQQSQRQHKGLQTVQDKPEDNTSLKTILDKPTDSI